MSIFDLSDISPRRPQFGAIPETRLSAGRAWASSMLLPGAGQIYCGAVTRGWAMAAVSIIAIAAVIFFQHARYVALSVLVIFYALGSLDAYLTACDYNVGVDVEAPNNPRVAALLNMTTNGFGYFYAGVKGGILLVILGGVVMRAVAKTQPLLLELFRAAIAIHAWKIAAKQREEDYPADKRPQIEESTFPRGVPITVTALIAGHYWLLVIIGQIAIWSKR